MKIALIRMWWIPVYILQLLRSFIKRVTKKQYKIPILWLY